MSRKLVVKDKGQREGEVYEYTNKVNEKSTKEVSISLLGQERAQQDC